MNTQLYNQLIQARNFLITVEKNESDLAYRKEEIKITNANHHVLTPKEMPKKFSWIIFLLLLECCGAGIIYALYIFIHNRKAKKKQKQLDELYNSPKEIQKRKENEMYAEMRKRELEMKTAEYKRYYNDNYWKCLGFLPDWARKLDTVDSISRRRKYIEGLLNYVKSGARTLEDAMEYYAEELREIDARETAREREEMLERRHKEEMAALNTIARNQERTNDELNRMYREKYLTRH